MNRLARLVLVSLTVLVTACGSDEDPRPLITISAETTRITEPLTEDGYPDYLAVLNARRSEGVTPSNNAAVLLWRVLGPGMIKPEVRERFLTMLGIQPLPEEGEYLDLEGLEAWPDDDRHNSVSLDVFEAAGRLWTRKEFPAAAAWLDANREHLDLIVEASRRERFYSPSVANERAAVYSVHMPELHPLAEARHCLLARAMLCLAERRVEPATEDLFALHRLGRHVASRGSPLAGVFGASVDHGAFEAVIRLIHHTAPSPVQLRAYSSRHENLPPLTGLVEAFDLTDRLAFLDGVCALAEDPHALDNEWSTVQLPFPPGQVDLDEIMRMGHRWFDAVVVACRRPAHQDRLATIAELGPEEPTPASIPLAAPLRQGRTRVFGDTLLSRLVANAKFLATGIASREERAAIRSTAFALCAYRADRGVYPESLADLVPEYLPGIPLEPYELESLRYARKEKGFKLWGPDFDGEYDKGEWPDDLVISVP